MIDLESTIEQIVENEGASLYDVELLKDGDGLIYRVSITSPNGVGVDLCAKISNLISPILDTNPPTGANYFLEVSSPGIERKLRKPVHFVNAVGELIKFKFGGEKYKGKLLIANKDEVVIEVEGEKKHFSYDEIAKVKTYLVW